MTMGSIVAGRTGASSDLRPAARALPSPVRASCASGQSRRFRKASWLVPTQNQVLVTMTASVIYAEEVTDRRV